jgi:hypothetical protein
MYAVCVFMPKYLPLFYFKIRTKYRLLVEDCPVSADMADPPDLQVCHRVSVTVLLTLHTMSSLLISFSNPQLQLMASFPHIFGDLER